MSASQITSSKHRIASRDDGINQNCGGTSNPGIRTAIGCIPINPKSLVNLIVSWTAGLGGGVALLMIFYAGFVMTTAGGDLKKVSQARTIITSAVIGLAIIVLAVLILNFLGVSVFGLNTLGFKV
jgi:hypothetical protein